MRVLDFSVVLEDGKYEYRFYKDGSQEALRNGEPWRDLSGDKFIYCMAAEISKLQVEVQRAYMQSEAHKAEMYAKLYAAPAVPDDVVKDAERYRVLRTMHWSNSPLCVVTNPKDSVKIGSYCPSEERLDEILDDERKKRTQV